MKLIHSTAATLLALLLTLFIPLAIAGPGHDHGDTAPKPQVPRCLASLQSQRIWNWSASSMGS